MKGKGTIAKGVLYCVTTVVPFWIAVLVISEYIDNGNINGVMIVSPILNKAQMTEEGIKRYLDADLDNPELRDELLDYFVDKIYIDDDGKLSFVLKLYDKDEVELQEVSEDEIFDFVGVEVFDNFGLCSTTQRP